MSVEEFFDRVSSVKLPEDCESLDIIDQTLLPGTVKRINLRTKEELWEAIKKLRVRGAPAIGVAAAEGLAMLANKIDTTDQQEFYRQFKEIADYLATSRPTAVNLFWALNRMDAFCHARLDLPVDQLKQELVAESRRIREEDVQISRNIGAIGFKVMQQVRKPGQPVGILTHCNAGTLATAKYGTATAPMYTALEQGWAGTDMHVYCDETRPLLQGARLTSFELYNAGITTTLQCDNMVSMLMQQGRIDVVFVGCDRVAANGDAATRSAPRAWPFSPSTTAFRSTCVPPARPSTTTPPPARRFPSRCATPTRSPRCGTRSAWRPRAWMSSTPRST